METIGFGGGCHWCTEAVFQSLRGIENVEQGFISSDPPQDSFSEAVLIEFDHLVIPLETLIEVHLRTHASTSNHKMRGKYRSAIYVFDDRQALKSQSQIALLQAGFDRTVVTQILRCREFKLSDQHFQNYYLRNPDRPFCKSYIDPKLKLLSEHFASDYKII